MEITHEKFISLAPGDAAIVIRENDEIVIHLPAPDDPQAKATRAAKMAAMLFWAAGDEQTAIRFTKDVNQWMQENEQKQN